MLRPFAGQRAGGQGAADDLCGIRQSRFVERLSAPGEFRDSTGERECPHAAVDHNRRPVAMLAAAPHAKANGCSPPPRTTCASSTATG
jgi:hypothetical protein